MRGFYALRPGKFLLASFLASCPHFGSNLRAPSPVERRMPSRRAIVVGLGLISLPGCGKNSRDVAPAPKNPGERASLLIENVPHVRQKPDFCGEAVVASFAQAAGAEFDQDDVFDLSGMDPARGMGVTTSELKTALERMGFDPGPVWHDVPVDDAPAELARMFDELYA